MVVVTGAGTSLGTAVAHRFVAVGYTVALVGRAEATLRQTSKRAWTAWKWHPRVGDVLHLGAKVCSANSAPTGWRSVW
ncbi:SDR family NAD(P)-dependent oxidoreductase [Streptomyces scabichelini]|uniref:SDR family NAD(P)-dependent oxidoreductase n=1 Tax=Streptomyces scabichelini TaxID=2711217 RepID=UPI003B96DA6F